MKHSYAITQGNAKFLKLMRPLLFLFIFSILSFVAKAQITGTVYRDFNANGQKDGIGENGVAGVVVRATPSVGLAISTTTNASGTYSIPIAGTGPYRVEFSNYPSNYYSGPKGSLSGTSVQFVIANNSSANLGINYPSDYCQSKPPVAMSCFVSGDPLKGGSTGEDVALVKVAYDADNTSVPSPTELSLAKVVGGVWGIAYQKETQTLFSAAVMKRHVGFGKLGIGGIYATNAANSTSEFIDVKTIGIDVGTDIHTTLQGSKSESSQDPAAFDAVGKLGIGDIDISEDGKYLFMVNLKDRKIYRIFIDNPVRKPTTADTLSFAIPNPCNDANNRPWGLKYYHNKLYVGVVCSAESSKDTSKLNGTIYEMDPNTGASKTVLSFPMSYKRGFVDLDDATMTYWQPWTSTFPTAKKGVIYIYPQPIISDIEFDVDGSMIIGIMDRFGHQTGLENELPSGGTLITAVTAGDILRAEPSGTEFKLESNGKSNGISTAGAGNKQGPGGGEYYFEDNLVCCSGREAHQETFSGGLALLPGSGEVVYSAIDPVQDVTWAGGMRRLSNTTGKQTGAYYLYKDAFDPNLGYFGKANGIGDIEILCGLPSLEIGNRVWNDLNGNGIQDASELGIGNIVLELYKNNVKVGQTTTNSSGEYYFNASTVTQNGATGLLPNTAYEIRVATTQAGIANYNVSTANVGTNDALDTDAVKSGNSLVISLTTGNLGENNHTYDIGLNTCPVITATGSAVCVGGTIGLSAAIVSGTVTGYAWAGPSAFTSTLQNPSRTLATNTIGGIYTVTATGQSGCLVVATASVSINALPAISTQSATVCEGGTISVSVSASNATAYSWVGPSAFTSSIQQPTRADASAAMAGVYSITVTNTNGCSASTTLTVSVTPPIVVPPSAVSFCPGGSATLEVNGGTGASYLWPDASTGNSINVSVAGTYDVNIRDAKGCKAKASFTTTLFTVAPLVLKASPACDGGTLNLSATGASSYEWGGPNFSSTLQNPSILNATVIAAGSYTAIGVDANSCTNSATIDVQISPKPEVTLANIAALCSGNTLNLSATSATASTYAWAGPASFSSTLQNPSRSGIDFTMAGIYTATASTSAGCFNTATVAVKIGSLPVAQLASNGPLCIGTTLELSVTVANKYAWAGPDGFSSTVQKPQKENVTLASAGQYTLTVVSAEGCSTVSKIKVDVNPDPIPVLGSNSPVCVGGSVQLSVSGGNAYSWTGPNGFSSTLQNPTRDKATTDMQGVYSVSLTASTGCTASTSLSIQINSQGAAASANSPICIGSTIKLQATSGTSYTWAGPNGFTTTEQSPNIANASASMAGTYSVTVSGQEGCTGTATVVVKTNPKPIVTALSNSPVCTGNTLDLSATGGISYAWAGPNDFVSSEQNPSLTLVNISKSGVYAVSILDTNQCSNTASVSVVIYQKPNLVLSSNGPVCAGSALNLTATGGDSFSWKGPEGFTSTSKTPSRPLSTTSMLGLYSVTASTSVGCSATATINIEISQLSPKASASSDTYCVSTSIELSASGGDKYQWKGPGGFTSTDQNPSRANASKTMAGIYSVTISQGSCSATAQTINLVVIDQGATATSKGAVCEGKTLELMSSQGDNYTWSGPNDFTSTLQNPTLTNATTSMSGVYSLVVSGQNGCTGTATISATVHANPQLVVSNISSLDNGVLCEGKTLSMSATGGTGYLWAGPNQFNSTLQNPIVQNITPQAVGIYSVTATNSNQCLASTTLSIVTKNCVIPYGSIGDFVWNDTNDDGIQDIGETGIKNVKVELYKFDGTSYVVVKTISTDANGAYRFDSLLTGDYKVKFTPSNIYLPAKKDQGNDDTKDSDAGTDGFTGIIKIDTSKPATSLLRNNTSVDAAFTPRPKCINPAAPVVKADKTELCLAESTTMVGTSAGNIIRWYLSASGGNSIKTTSSGQGYTVSPSTTTTYYVEAAITDSCLSLSRTPVTIVVNAKPLTPVCSGNTSNICPDVFVDLTLLKLSDISTIDGKFEWHTGPLASSAILANPAKVLLSGNYYLFEKSKSGCYSNPAIIVVNINSCECQNPARANAGLDQIVCANDTVFLKGTVGGAASRGTWTSTTNGIFGDANELATYYIPSSTDLKAGFIHLTLTTIEDDLTDNCEVASDAISIDLNALPDKPFGLSCADSILCIGEGTRLFALSNGGKIKWFDTAKGGKVLATVDSGKAFDVSPTTTTTYWAEATSTKGCVNPDRSPITVYIKKCYTDLLVDKKVLTPLPHRKGQNIVYAITVSNLGPVDANDVLVTDQLPSDLSFVSSVPPTQYDATTGVWTVGKLTKGSTRTLAITAKANAFAIIINKAYVSSPNNDLSKSKNDTSSASINTIEVSDLSLRKMVSNTKPYLNDEIIYSIELSNAGPNNATNIEIKDVLPAGLSFVSSTDLTAAGNTMTVKLAELKAGFSKLYNYKVKVTAEGKISNAAEITKADQPDPDSVPGNGIGKNEDDEAVADIEARIKCDILPPSLSCSSTSICAGDTVSIFAAGCNGTTIWNTGQIGNKIIVNPKTSTEYSAECLEGKCKSDKAIVKIETGNTKTVVLSCANTAICYGGSSTITALGCENGNIIWSNGMVGTSITVKPTQTTNYLAYCQVNNCLSEASRPITINVTAQIEKVDTKDLINVCPMTTVSLWDGILSKPTTKGGVFEFHLESSPNSAIIADPSKINKTGSYIVFEKTTIGCYSKPCVVHVLITNCGPVLACNTNPATADAGPDAEICSNRIIQLNGKIGGAASSAKWSANGTGTFNNPLLLNATYTASLEDIQKGSVSLHLTTNDPDGLGACTAASDSLILKVGGIKIKPSIAILGTLNLCFGDSVTLKANENGYKYLWSNGQTSQSITVAKAGSYHVSLVSNQGCLSVECDPVEVSIGKAIPTPKVVETLSNTCPNPMIDLSKALVSSLSASDSKFSFQTGAAKTSPKVLNPADVGQGVFYVFERTSLGCYSQAAKINVILKDCAKPIVDTTQKVKSANLSLRKTTVFATVKQGRPIVFTLTVKNAGPSKATNVEVKDLLPGGLTFESGNLVKYDAITNAVVARFDSIAVGDSAKVSFTVIGNQVGKITNRAEISKADQTDPNSTPNNGLDNKEDDTSSATVTIQSPDQLSNNAIGLAKFVSNFTRQADGSFDVTYSFILKNYGKNKVDSLQIIDSLVKVFPSNVPFKMKAITGSRRGILKVNLNYDGLRQTNLLDARNAGSLAAGQSDTLSFMLNVQADAQTTPFLNSAIAFGQVGGKTISDLSTDGKDPDTDGDGNPAEAGSTPLFIIGSVSGLFIPEGFSPNGDGINDKFVIENLNNETTLSLKIYNIWGMVVYEQADYKNEWDGNANAGTTPGFLGRAGLPDGTYLYSIHLSDNRVFMKYLTISR